MHLKGLNIAHSNITCLICRNKNSVRRRRLFCLLLPWSVQLARECTRGRWIAFDTITAVYPPTAWRYSLVLWHQYVHTHILYKFWLVSTSTSSSSSRMHVMNYNWSATKQRLRPQSVAEISRHSVLSGDSIRRCEKSSGSRHKDTDHCKSTFPSAGTAVSLF